MQRLTKEQSVIIGAYTNILCGDFSDLHEYIEKLLGRPVYTHELASAEIVELVKEKAYDDFISICYEGE